MYYISVGEMMIKHEGAQHPLFKLVIDATGDRTVGIANLRYRGFHIFFEKDILLVIQAADIFIENNHNPDSSHMIHDYRHGRALLQVHQVCHGKHDRKSFQIFLVNFFACIEKQRCCSCQICFCSLAVCDTLTTTQAINRTTESD